MRIAVYCRVSSKKDLQLNSLETQKKFYQALVSSRVKDTLVDVYIDIGSGLSLKTRPEFARMIKDCRERKIDLIITKSISRFGRDVLQFLKIIRELKRLKVDVWFESDNILLSKEKGEMNMTIIEAIAEQESRNRSNNTKWGIKNGFQSGTSGYADKVCYGYKKNNDGRLIIDNEKAKNVQLIFEMYLDGYSLSKIVKELERIKIVSPTGKELWTSKAIDNLLSNEKYIGNAILQKTYIKDLFDRKQVKNNGEINRYLYENNNEPIISVEIYNKVQEEKKNRSNITQNGNKVKRNETRYSSSNTLSGKIICGECGRSYRRITTHSGEIVWRCAGRVEKGSQCNNRTVKQNEIDNLLIEKFGTKLDLKKLKSLKICKNGVVMC